MRKIVSDSWLALNAPFEGHVTWMYLDQHKDAEGNLDPLVTTGCGNLIDPLTDEVLRLPWRHPNGSMASTQAITACWRLVKESFKRGGMNPLNGGGRYALLPGNTLRLPEEAIVGLVRHRLFDMAGELRKPDRFPAFDEWCADAQAATHSMSWAMGPGGFAKFPRFSRAANERDWLACARECTVHPDEGTIKLRNAMQRRMFEAARRVEDERLDPDLLHFQTQGPSSIVEVVTGLGPLPESNGAAISSADIGRAIRKAIEHDKDPDD